MLTWLKNALRRWLKIEVEDAWEMEKRGASSLCIRCERFMPLVVMEYVHGEAGGYRCKRECSHLKIGADSSAS